MTAGLLTTLACLGLIIFVAFLSACSRPEPESAAPVAPAVTALAEVATPETVEVYVHQVTSTVARSAVIEGTLLGAKLGSPQLTKGREVSVRWADQTPKRMHVVPVAPTTSPSFVLKIDGLEPGPQSVCIDDSCHRVLVAETTKETESAIHAKIATALERAETLVNAHTGMTLETALPDWMISIGGHSTSAGGNANHELRIITINATSGRSIEDFTITVLHEVAHALDTTYLRPADRTAFLSLRGIDSTTAWMPSNLAPEDRWLSPSEDFAEAFVVWMTGGEHQTRSALADQPSTEQLAFLAELGRNWAEQS